MTMQRYLELRIQLNLFILWN
uniref:Uncharacterized protein n=1 Tax=Anguilla anguilla TaxID=7936 RepID=A0A0E9UEF5_ANGAN